MNRATAVAASGATREISLEELRETMVDLERARRHEQQLRFESEGLLEGLTALTEARDTSQVFDRLSQVLRRFVPFEDAFILLADGDGILRSLRATAPIFEPLAWRAAGMLHRVLDGQTISLFDTAHVPEWQDQSSAVRARVRSAIHAPLRTETLSAVLVFVHSQPAFFTGDQVRLLKRLAPLTNQALASIEYRQRLERQSQELRAAQQDLLAAARLAGMAEIATNVLHNVGNVLNSVNISAGLVNTRLRTSKLNGLARAVRLMDEHADDLGEFLTGDARGKLLPTYLRELAPALELEHEAMAEELLALGKSVDHIKEVIATQQSYAGTPRFVESLKLDELVDDALRMNASALTRHKVNVVKDLAELPPLLLDRNRVLQILVNLISNAKQAMNGIACPCITLGASFADQRLLRITIADNGEGIAPEHLTRVFSHGFTTRQDGHGFGLHSCVIAAQEMGGSLSAHSDGQGQGATFSLEIPIAPQEGKR